MPPRSTKAPKSAMFLTTPSRNWPTIMVARSWRLASSRSSSMSRRRETTMLRRSASIFRILHLMRSPMYVETSAGRRISTWLAGKKTGTPMSTSRPPLILRLTRPSTTSPSAYVFKIRSQPLIRSALRFDSSTRPLSSSTASKRTSTFWPTTTALPSNSSSGTLPSLLNPTSMTASLPMIRTTRPATTLPVSNAWMESSYNCSSWAGSSIWPRTAWTSRSTSVSFSPYSR